MLRLNLTFSIIIKVAIIGRDPTIVYIMKYHLASRRSGWDPHPIIRKKVGIIDISKKMYINRKLSTKKKAVKISIRALRTTKKYVIFLVFSLIKIMVTVTQMVRIIIHELKG